MKKHILIAFLATMLPSAITCMQVPDANVARLQLERAINDLDVKRVNRIMDSVEVTTGDNFADQVLSAYLSGELSPERRSAALKILALLQIGHLDKDTSDLYFGLFKGHSFFQVAVERQLYSMVESLIRAGYRPNSADRYGVTPLHNAATICDVKMIQLLAVAGTNINAGDNLGHTPLYYAAHIRSVEAVQKLIELGALVGVQDNGAQWNIMHTVCFQGDLALFKVLLTANDALEAMNLKALNGWEPLDVLAHYHPTRRVEFIEALNERIAHVKRSRTTQNFRRFSENLDRTSLSVGATPIHSPRQRVSATGPCEPRGGTPTSEAQQRARWAAVIEQAHERRFGMGLHPDSNY